jgi:hypothetical protein
MYENTAQPTVAGLHQGTTMQPATSGTRDNRAPTRLNRAAMRYPAPPSASYGAGTPFHRSPYLPRCTGAVGPAGDTSSEFLHPRSRRQEALREPGRSTDPAVTS